MSIITSNQEKIVSSKDFGGKLADSMGAIAVIAIGVGLWIVGAWLTLYALSTIGIPVSALGRLAWLIPLGISCIEVRFWPKDLRGVWSYRTGMLSAIGLLDLASTFFGGWSWLKGRYFTFFTGIQMPADGPVLLAVCTVGSILLTFVPERLIVSPIRDLLAIWNIRHINLGFITLEV